MDPKLFAALGGGQPAQAPQQPAPAPAPAGSPAPGAGLSLFQGLAPQSQTMGAQPLQIGPQVADASDLPSNPVFDFLEKVMPADKPAPPPQDNSMQGIATKFFDKTGNK